MATSSASAWTATSDPPQSPSPPTPSDRRRGKPGSDKQFPSNQFHHLRQSSIDEGVFTQYLLETEADAVPGLHADSVNKNQGTEFSVAFHIAQAEMEAARQPIPVPPPPTVSLPTSE